MKAEGNAICYEHAPETACPESSARTVAISAGVPLSASLLTPDPLPPCRFSF